MIYLVIIHPADSPHVAGLDAVPAIRAEILDDPHAAFVRLDGPERAILPAGAAVNAFFPNQHYFQ